MLIETLSVREAREQLPSLLDRFRHGERAPVGVGSHRKTEAVMISVDVFNELTSERSRAASQATASVEAEELMVSDATQAIMQRWALGEISATEMRTLVRKLHGLP